MDELGHQIRAFVVDRGLVQSDDSRMREPGGGAGLALEPAADHALTRQDLDRHLAIEPIVSRQPNGGESSGAETPAKPVATEDDRRVGSAAAPVLVDPLDASRIALRGGPNHPGRLRRRATSDGLSIFNGPPTSDSPPASDDARRGLGAGGIARAHAPFFAATGAFPFSLQLFGVVLPPFRRSY